MATNLCTSPTITALNYYTVNGIIANKPIIQKTTDAVPSSQNKRTERRQTAAMRWVGVNSLPATANNSLQSTLASFITQMLLLGRVTVGRQMNHLNTSPNNHPDWRSFSPHCGRQIEHGTSLLVIVVVEQGLTSHSTQFRSFRRRCFYRSDDPTNHGTSPLAGVKVRCGHQCRVACSIALIWVSMKSYTNI